MSETNDAVVEPSESTGLLDGVEAQDSSQDSQQDAKKSEIEHRAADSIPEDEPIDRPDYWPENFFISKRCLVVRSFSTCLDSCFLLLESYL